MQRKSAYGFVVDDIKRARERLIEIWSDDTEKME